MRASADWKYWVSSLHRRNYLVRYLGLLVLVALLIHSPVPLFAEDQRIILPVSNSDNVDHTYLDQAIPDAKTGPVAPAIELAFPETGLHTIGETSALFPITGTAVVDGYTAQAAVPASTGDGFIDAPLQIVTTDDGWPRTEQIHQPAATRSRALGADEVSPSQSSDAPDVVLSASARALADNWNNAEATDEFVPCEIVGSNFPVTSVDNSGPGTLRQAIADANTNPGKDTITFSLGDPTSLSIAPSTPLPLITDPVVIDGTCQPGWSGHPLVEISGDLAGSGAVGFEITAGDSKVRGLIINQFHDTGIVIRNNGGSVIEGNYVGTDHTIVAEGAILPASQETGIRIIDSSQNLIGGNNLQSRNLVSGNFVGITISNSGSFSNTVQGNYIGTDTSGMTALPNSYAGVLISAEDGRTDYASNNLVGGHAAGAGNLISGNGWRGVEIFGGTGNRVSGNRIGTTADGLSALANERTGVFIMHGSQNLIGGVQPGCWICERGTIQLTAGSAFRG